MRCFSHNEVDSGLEDSFNKIGIEKNKIGIKKRQIKKWRINFNKNFYQSYGMSQKKNHLSQKIGTLKNLLSEKSAI